MRLTRFIVFIASLTDEQCSLTRHCRSLSSTQDLAVKTRGGKVLTTSDEWFAESHNLLTAAAPISRKGHFTPKGAWFDGWETRRHGPEFDWYVLFFQL